MDARIKGKSFPGEILCISSDLEVFFTDRYTHTLLCEGRAAGQAADAGSDDYDVEII
jgi:hypothetical protein